MPSSVHPAAVSTVYALAAPSLVAKLLPRVRAETVELLSSGAPVPSTLVEEVISSGERELLEALASAAHRQPAVYERLAALGDPGIAATLWRTARERRLRVMVWEGAASTLGDPAWRAEDGLVTTLLESYFPRPGLAELSSPFPDLARKVLAETSMDYALREHVRATAGDQLHGCRTILRHGGPSELREVAEMAEFADLDPEVAERVRLARASAEPEKVLGRPLGEGEGNTAEASTGAPALPEPEVDAAARTPWGSLLAAHRAEPFTSAGLRWLWGTPGCPEELAVAAWAAAPTLSVKGPVYWSMVTAVDFNAAGTTLSELLPEGIASGVFPVDRVLDEVGPARKVLEALPYPDERVRAALAPHVTRLGADFAEWRALHTLLPRFKGSVGALVDAALKAAPKHRGLGWPKPQKAGSWPTEPSLSRAAWLSLFELADPATQRGLVEHLDDRGLQHLLARELPAELWVHLTGRLGTARLAELQPWSEQLDHTWWRTPPEVVEDLLTYDDPQLNTALYLSVRLTDQQRRHVLSGRRHGGQSVDHLPLAEEILEGLRERGRILTDEHRQRMVSGERWLRDEGGAPADRLPITPDLFDKLRYSGRRHWLLPAAESGDPLLCRTVLGNTQVKLHTDALNLLLLVRLWERHGPEEVRALLDETVFPSPTVVHEGKHPMPAHLHQTARGALEASDGLAVLRQARREAAGPTGLVAHLRLKGYGDSSDDPLSRALGIWEEEVGPVELPWPELSSAHHAQPLHDQLLESLAQRPGCPADLLDAATEARLRRLRGYVPRRGSRPRPARETLRGQPLPELAEHRGDWLRAAHGAGRITWPEVVECAFPARSSAAFLAELLTPEGSEPPGEDVREVRRNLVELAHTHLGVDDPDAWALLLALLPDFEGTLPELLSAAGAAMS